MPLPLCQVLVETALVFSLVWAVGGTVDEAGRQLFSKSLRAFLQGEQWGVF